MHRPHIRPHSSTRVLRALSRTSPPAEAVYVQTNSSSANEVIVYGYGRDAVWWFGNNLASALEPEG